MAEMTMEDIGKLAYADYGKTVGGKTWDGKPLPTWEELTPKIQKGWIAAGTALPRHNIGNRLMGGKVAILDYNGWSQIE